MPETRGSTVPQKTTAMTPIKSRFCRTNALSRETVGAGRLVLAREPERNASSAIEKTRHTNRNPKNHGPIALTANVFKSDRDACLASGMEGFLGKPLDLDELQDVLSRCHRLSRPEHSKPPKFSP